MNSSFFILGYPRSGTTLFRAMLNSHARIAIPYESFVLVDFAKRCSSEFNKLINREDRQRFVNALLNSKGIKE